MSVNPKTTASDADIDAAVLAKAAEQPCPACEGLTTEWGMVCCWSCGRVLPTEAERAAQEAPAPIRPRLGQRIVLIERGEVVE